MKRGLIKRILIFTYIVLLSVCIVVSGGFLCNSWKEYNVSVRKYNQLTEYEFITKRITYFTKMFIPEDAEMVYNYYTKKAGDLNQYTCFKFTEDPTEFLEEHFFRNGLAEQIEETFNENFYDLGYSKYVPNKYEPNLKDNCLEHKNGAFYFFYFPNEHMLIVLCP